MTRISYEFFPPRETASLDRLIENVADKLQETKPSFFSVTYGAGGSTRKGTFETVSRLTDVGCQAVPHLSIGGDDEDAVVELLSQYKDRGVNRIVALRGDLPSGIGRARFRGNAEQLVRLIRERFEDHFSIEVAAYPEVHPDAHSADDDLEFFKRKVDAGANSAITQYFYNPYAYLDFRERCAQANINIPIHVGIMPITNFESIMRFSSGCGADVPRWMQKKMESLQSDETALRDFGVETLSRMCNDLIRENVPGFHFYTLNRWGATRRILDNLNL